MSENTGERGVIRRAVDKAQEVLRELAELVGVLPAPSADSFVDRMAVIDMYEIASARLVLRRASSPAVLAFADLMLAEHTTSTHHRQAALEMNETKGVAPPSDELDERHEEMLEQLRAAPDDSFESTYLDQQVEVHEEETTELLRRYRDQGEVAQLRSYAAAFAPLSERHLQLARELRAH